MNAKSEAKSNPWTLIGTGIVVFAIYVFAGGLLISDEPNKWIRSSVWGLVPIGGILSTIVLMKEDKPKGFFKSVFFALHLANLALAIVVFVLMLVMLPGIIRGTDR